LDYGVAVLRPLKFFTLFFSIAVLISTNSHAEEKQRRFDFSRDTFSFQNDTLWAYSVDADGKLHMQARAKPPEYTRRCFVLVRSALQFHKYAEFDAGKPKLDDAGYRKLVRHIARIPIWMPQIGRRTVVPGYADLRSFSKAHAKLLQDELGNWWPNYFRLGNWRMAMPFPRAWQKKLARELVKQVDAGKIQAVFITRFRPINHCVIVYDYKARPDGGIVFLAYDPNDAQKPRTLEFDAKTRNFILCCTSYFNGGCVNATKAYILPWQ
jgi:hypothetical protein